MAGKESRSMQGYVQDKNPGQLPTRQTKAPGGKASFDDLKVATSKTKAAPNSGQTRSNGHHRHKSAQEYADSRAAQRDSAGPKVFYDTDASSIEASSTTASANHSNAGVTRGLQNGHTNGHPSGFEASGSADGSEGDSGDEEFDGELPDNQLQGSEDGLSERQRRLMAEKDYVSNREKLSRGVPLPYLKGDSYPVTSSGNLSVADSTELKTHDKKSQMAPQAEDHIRQATSMRTRLYAPSAQIQSQSRQAHTKDDRDRSTVQEGLIVRSEAGHGGLLEHQVSNNFAFGKPSKTQMEMRPPAKTREQASTEAKASRPPVLNNTVYQPTISSANDNSNRGPHLAQEAVHTAGKHVEPQQHHQRESKLGKKSRTSTTVEKQVIVTAPEHDQVSDVDVGIQHGQSADAGMQEHVVEPEGHLLDYSAEDLFKMDYHELKAESFDVDPNASGFEFPSIQLGTDLNSKLDAVAALDQQQQINFFASLPINEWEQAGDWFVAQFGDVLNKLKTNRQEKREVAKAFENEIEKRHEAVSKKRKQTEDELSGMKESGVKVLQGTPKKARTK